MIFNYPWYIVIAMVFTPVEPENEPKNSLDKFSIQMLLVDIVILL